MPKLRLDFGYRTAVGINNSFLKEAEKEVPYNLNGNLFSTSGTKNGLSFAGALILDDCDTDTYGLEQAVDFIKGKERICLCLFKSACP